MWKIDDGKIDHPPSPPIRRKTPRRCPSGARCRAAARRRRPEALSSPPRTLIQHRGSPRLDPLEIGERFGKARARNDDHAVAIGVDHVA